jgi:hypothetical protein
MRIFFSSGGVLGATRVRCLPHPNHVKLIHFSHVADTAQAATANGCIRAAGYSWRRAFTKPATAARFQGSKASQAVHGTSTTRAPASLPVPYGRSGKQSKTTRRTDTACSILTHTRSGHAAEKLYLHPLAPAHTNTLPTKIHCINSLRITNATQLPPFLHGATTFASPSPSIAKWALQSLATPN